MDGTSASQLLVIDIYVEQANLTQDVETKCKVLALALKLSFISFLCASLHLPMLFF